MVRPGKIILIVGIIAIFLWIAIFSFAQKPTLLAAPGRWIPENQIFVYPSKVVIEVKNASWAGFANTKSMVPFLDQGAHALEIMPENLSSINVGDVIAYRSENNTIIHRVLEKGEDKQGLYFIVKGDNNDVADSEKVRAQNLKGVLVAIIY